MKAKREEGDGRILLGNNAGGSAVVLRADQVPVVWGVRVSNGPTFFFTHRRIVVQVYTQSGKYIFYCAVLWEGPGG